MIHSALAIPINKNFKKFKALNDERCDISIKTYTQFQLLILNEITLVGNRMLSFIDHKLRIIKKVLDNFMGGLDVIMSSDFYQDPSIQDSWIFKPRLDGLNILETFFWYEHVKCYELKQIMQQNDANFIDILNQFCIASKIHDDISFINKICLKMPPIDTTLPYLFHTNAKTIEHDKNKFQNTLGETFKFVTHDTLRQIPHFLTNQFLATCQAQLALNYIIIFISTNSTWLASHFKVNQLFD
jgi:hypothetical protein